MTAPVSNPPTAAAALAEVLFAASAEALAIVDAPGGRVLSANAAACRLLGFDPADMPLAQLFSSAELIEHIRSAVLLGRTHIVESARVSTPCSEVVLDVRVEIRPTVARQAVLALSGPNRADDGRRQLADTESEWQRLLEAVNDCLWSADLLPDGSWEYRFLSPVVERITGRPAEHFLAGRARWLEIIHPDDQPRVKNSDKMLPRGMRNAIDAEYRFRIVRPDGGIRWVHDRVRVTGAMGGAVRLDGVLSDVTAQTQAELALRGSEDRMRRVVDNNPHGIVMLSAEGRVRYANVAAERLFGWPRGGMTDARWADLAKDSSPPLDSELFPTAGKETVLVRRDGSRVYVVPQVTRLRGPAGEYDGVVVAFDDLTARVQAEWREKAQTRQLEIALSQMPAVLFTTDLECRFTSSLGAGLKELRLRPNEVVGRTLSEYLQSDSPDVPPVAACRKALAGEPSTYEFHWQGRDYVTIVEPLRNAERKIVGTINLGLDVTDRRRAEELVLQSEERFRKLLENATDGVQVLTASGRLMYQTPRAEQLFGLSVGQDCNAPEVLEMFVAEEIAAIQPEWDRLTRTPGATAHFPLRVRRPGRPELSIDLVVRNLVEDPLIAGILLTSRDVTEQRNLAEQLHQAAKLEAVGQLAGGVAHDFNNLLTAILGHLSLLRRRLLDDDAGAAMVDECEQAANRAAGLTRQLLSFARRSVLATEAADLRVVASEVTALLMRTLDPRIEIRLESPKELGSVRADVGQIHQVLMNLCLNARDAMPAGGRLTVSLDNIDILKSDSRGHLGARPGPFVRLRVSDTGTGMTPDVEAHLFEPFFTTKGPGRGTGLGLSNALGIVQQHDGWITVDTAVGRGTTFDVFLPRQSSLVNPALSPPLVSPRGGGETILVVDDEPMIRSLAQATLEQLGYRVLLAADGEEAVAMFRSSKNPIDLVILDLTMPRLSGQDACQVLMSINPAVKVVYSSGYTADGLSAEERDGACGFLSKPYRPAQLAAIVRTALDQPQER